MKNKLFISKEKYEVNSGTYSPFTKFETSLVSCILFFSTNKGLIFTILFPFSLKETLEILSKLPFLSFFF